MPSFDIVSKVAIHEVDNAVLQAQKEVIQRFDFKDTGTEIEKTADGIVLRSGSEGRLDAAYKVLIEKMIRRGVAASSLDAGDPQPAGGSTWRQVVKLKEGITTEKAREIVKLVKDSKLKVQTAIQGDQLRVTGKKRDELQEVISTLRAQDFGQPLQFINMRD